ncbi:hypothetical protein HHK36_008301 [Tetracentron sinense]|uniref:Uncharacterized protein n=1 Tax=Tetracentron sinense TaxID=13715 RepID=A0A835DJW8_TETSI|nr:hypothetical protein HHK36_008301 [Tetracentron sinense]
MHIFLEIVAKHTNLSDSPLLIVEMGRYEDLVPYIMKKQMTYLEEWALLDRDHSSSLSGAIEALKDCTLRLPVVGGARADIQNVKDAVGLVADMMQAMTSSICSLLSKVEEVNSLVAELANVTTKERALLNKCKDLLLTLATMQEIPEVTRKYGIVGCGLQKPSANFAAMEPMEVDCIMYFCNAQSAGSGLLFPHDVVF